MGDQHDFSQYPYTPEQKALWERRLDSVGRRVKEKVRGRGVPCNHMSGGAEVTSLCAEEVERLLEACLKQACLAKETPTRIRRMLRRGLSRIAHKDAGLMPRGPGALYDVCLFIWCLLGLHRWATHGQGVREVIPGVCLALEVCEHCGRHRVWRENDDGSWQVIYKGRPRRTAIGERVLVSARQESEGDDGTR